MENVDKIEEKRIKNRERVAKYRQSIKPVIIVSGKRKNNPKSHRRLDTYINSDLMYELEQLAEYYELSKKEMIEQLIKEKFADVSGSYSFKEFKLDRNYRVTIDPKTGRTIRRNIKTGEIMEF